MTSGARPPTPDPRPQRLILASASPRRLELLGRLAGSFDTAFSTVEESGRDDHPVIPLDPLPLPPPFHLADEVDPRLWAWRKAHDVVTSLVDAEGALVLAADTVVVGPEEALGKPTDRPHAAQMLMQLRGRLHLVVTGFALLRVRGGEPETLHIEAVCSPVAMREFSQVELDAYLDTPEPYDKAGAYALQGLGGRLVERVDGCAMTVIGLPLCAVRRALEEHGVVLLPYPAGGYCANCQSVSNQ